MTSIDRSCSAVALATIPLPTIGFLWQVFDIASCRYRTYSPVYSRISMALLVALYAFFGLLNMLLYARVPNLSPLVLTKLMLLVYAVAQCYALIFWLEPSSYSSPQCR